MRNFVVSNHKQMDHATTILICILVLCACMILYKLLNKAENKLKNKQVEQTQAQFSPEQLKFLQTVGGAYKRNEVKSRKELLEECGIPHEIAYGNDYSLVEENIPFIKNQNDHDVFTTYLNTVAKRHDLTYRPIIPLSGETLGVNLHKTEKGIYQAIYGVVLYQEKTTVTNIAYNGCVWRSGPLRAGNLSVISNEITRFSPVDAGKIFITNERIIFIGKQKNVTKQIKIDEIISFNLYQDGILVNIPNKKPLLFKFSENKDFGIFEISDQLNQFIITMNRMMAGDYDQDLLAPNQSPKASAVNDIAKALVAKNYSEDLLKIIPEAKVGNTFSTSSIQRKYEMGYNRAGRLTDQLECLYFITPAENGKREWLVDGNDTEMLLRLIDAADPYPAMN